MRNSEDDWGEDNSAYNLSPTPDPNKEPAAAEAEDENPWQRENWGEGEWDEKAKNQFAE